MSKFFVRQYIVIDIEVEAKDKETAEYEATVKLDRTLQNYVWDTMDETEVEVVAL